MSALFKSNRFSALLAKIQRDSIGSNQGVVYTLTSRAMSSNEVGSGSGKGGGSGGR